MMHASTADDQLDPKTLITAVVSLDELPATLEALQKPNAETKVRVADGHVSG
jgi:hypothetical protein